jgi:predicted heme/steroid binding protein/uncharacterized membrane protein
MKEIDSTELAHYDGENGNPLYVAHNGRVFDVSESKLWKGGLHMQRHHGGSDLTTDIQAAPHSPDVLDRYPQVAVLKNRETVTRSLPDWLSPILARFPMLKRHPHPMTVHFPIVFMFSTMAFTILYLISRRDSFELTALYCLGAGLLFTPVAMTTGYYTWWLNYMARPMRPVTIKKRLSIILFAVEIIAFILRLTIPDVLAPFRLVSAIYLILILSLFPIVTALGWYGASLTFPVERN